MTTIGSAPSLSQPGLEPERLRVVAAPFGLVAATRGESEHEREQEERAAYVHPTSFRHCVVTLATYATVSSFGWAPLSSTADGPAL